MTNNHFVRNSPLWLQQLLYHSPLLLVLLLQLLVATLYACLIPLGEAPDEPAHLNYARFIAEHWRLPTTPAERQAAGYRSNWPPLYHLLAAGPVALVGDSPPARLKAVGDSPRRLLPTNGQTIAAFIHTGDESWPWRGLPLAWRLSRFVSVLLTTLAVLVTYLITWQLTYRRDIAAIAAALHAFIPQALFIGSVVNDDNLLILLAGLSLLMLISYAKRYKPLGFWPAFFIGVLLGLAIVAKYNALSLAGVIVIWLGWLAYRAGGRSRETIRRFGLNLAGLLLGTISTGGWWFVFIWRHFNQVGSQGWPGGALAALAGNTSDASLRNLAAGRPISLPGTAWLEWFTTLFQTFWGSFGGGGTINLPDWVYWVLALTCLAAYLPLISRFTFYALRFTVHSSLLTPHASVRSLPVGPLTPPSSRFTFHASRSGPGLHPVIILFLLTPLFFLPLPMLRFILSGGNVVETAQGRHLFPALPAIVFCLAWGLTRYKYHRVRITGRANPSRTTGFFAPFRRLASLTPEWLSLRLLRPYYLLPVFVFGLALYALPLIQASYPPPIPLRTTAAAATAENLFNIELAEGVTFIGYELGPVEAGIWPVTLVWQAGAVPTKDYLIQLVVTDAAARPIGGWIGQPVGGRYPTRAWDEGDVLRHTVPVPLMPSLPATEATLILQLLEAPDQPGSAPLTLARELALPASPAEPRTPAQLRADGLPAGEPLTYRGTVSLVLPNAPQAPELITPAGKTITATQQWTTRYGVIAHFLVDAHWPGGEYRLQSPHLPSSISHLAIPISNRPRQFEPPPMTQTLQANFGGQITLLGYDLPQRRVEPGRSFPVVLHWRADRPIGQNLTVFNHLLDKNQVQRGGLDRIPLRHYSVILWVPGEIVSDAYQIPVDPDAPPGVYWLDVGLYPAHRPDLPLRLYEAGQTVERSSVALGPIKVAGPPPGVTIGQAQPQYPLNVTFGQQITLLGFSLSNPDHAATQPDPDNPPSSTFQSPTLPTSHSPDLSLSQPPTLPLSHSLLPSPSLELFWQAETQPAANYTVFVHLLDTQGGLAAQFDGPPAAGAYPTGLWDPGEIIADERRLELGQLPAGRYTLSLGLYRPDTGERLPVPGHSGDALPLVEFEINEN